MQRLVFSVAVFSLLVLTGQGEAKTPFKNCFFEAGKVHQIAPELLAAIAFTESSMNPVVINKNRDGTEDRGLMQINSWWDDELRARGVDPDHLLDGCLNIYVGAWVLKEEMKRNGYSWSAVGKYHTGETKDKKAFKRGNEYVERVEQNLPLARQFLFKR